MKYTVNEKTVEVWLEKPFDQPPDGFSLGEPLPKSHKRFLNCGIWEEKTVEVQYNCRSQEYAFKEENPQTCKHFVLTMDMTIHFTRSKGIKQRRLFGYYPRVIIAYNEGRNASTGICLDCFLEEFKENLYE